MEGNINEGEQTSIEGNTNSEYSGIDSGEYEGDSEDFDEDNYLGSDDLEYEEGDSSMDDEDFGGVDPAPLGGIYGLFKELVNKKDSKKVSNLTNEELGYCEFNVRDCQNISLLARTFNHPGVANYFEDRSRIITDTAMSRKGWFTELTVTSKKFASRDSSSSIQNLPQFQKKNTWKMFSKRDNQASMNLQQE